MVFEGAALVTLLLAPLVYLPSVFFMTMFGNVPMNNKLESLDHASAQAQGARQLEQEYIALLAPDLTVIETTLTVQIDHENTVMKAAADALAAIDDPANRSDAVAIERALMRL